MPPFLEDGDTIAAIAPSRWVPEGVLENARNILAGLGLNLVWDASINEQSGQFAGEDRHRASSMMKAWSNVEVKALWAARGGYGAQRILETLDSKAMQDAPKWFIGFSDSTAIHARLNQLGILSIHAPVLSMVPLVPVEDVDACASILQGGIWKGLECVPHPL
ncbi:MAG: LD-carboxypeptidase, partial [Flavobacteriales bacterium]|nr:LD-carboxypeptidase [Flavobacteriales bacterium]